MPKVFVSHAAVDKAVVELFVDLLEGMGVSHGDIFCTSIAGQIGAGQDFKSVIHKSLDEATVLIALLSENYHSSAFCMCELGGAWLQAKLLIPILIPPVEFRDLKAVLEGIQGLRIEDEQGLDNLWDELSKSLELKRVPAPRWSKKKTFLKSLKKGLSKVPKPDKVSRAELDEALLELEEYKTALTAAEELGERLAKRIEKLKKLKDKEEVAAVEYEELDAIEEFETLVAGASNALGQLYQATRLVLFQRFHDGNAYVPKYREDWDEAEDAIQYHEIFGEDSLRPDNSHPEVSRAIEALEALEEWLGSTDEDFETWYRDTHDGYQPVLRARHFWDRHLW